MGDFILFILACCAGYLVGSIPSSLMLTKMFADVDLRQVGSGNCGFSNAARVLGWKLALIVLAVDVLKGYLPMWLLPKIIGLDPYATLYGQIGQLILAITPIIGHVFSIFLGFRGGKGVATSIGVYLALAPLPCLVALAAGALVVAATRLMSLASITGAIVMSLCVPIIERGRPILTIVTWILAALIIYLHRSNIQRLIDGSEPRFGQRISSSRAERSSSKIFRKR